jgi:predicted nucleic acid-binding protein
VKVVADATPLIALAKIGELDLLHKLFHRIIVTPHVYAEVVTIGSGLPGSKETAAASWIEVRQIDKEPDLLAAQERFPLDIGELSSLVLAREIQADLVLLDDLGARKIAVREGMRVQSTIGVLEGSFLRGYITDLRLASQRLLENGIYLDRAFLDRRLQQLTPAMAAGIADHVLSVRELMQ